MPEPEIDEFQAYADAFRIVLEDAPQKLTRADILAEWPADFDKPADSTLKPWLTRAVELNLIQCEGTGHKSDPYRYWLPETEAKWREKLGPELYDVSAALERQHPFTSLQEKQRIDRTDDQDSADDRAG